MDLLDSGLSLKRIWEAACGGRFVVANKLSNSFHSSCRERHEGAEPKNFAYLRHGNVFSFNFDQKPVSLAIGSVVVIGLLGGWCCCLLLGCFGGPLLGVGCGLLGPCWAVVGCWFVGAIVGCRWLLAVEAVVFSRWC